MSKARGNAKSGHELYQIVLQVEEFFGEELNGEELAELVRAADSPPPNRDEV